MYLYVLKNKKIIQNTKIQNILLLKITTIYIKTPRNCMNIFFLLKLIPNITESYIKHTKKMIKYQINTK